MSARVILFGDGRWAAKTLRRLIDDGHQVPAVVCRTNPTDALLQTAAAALTVPVLQPARVNDPATVAELAGLVPDVLVSVAYDQILRKPILDMPPLGALNVHAGRLPRYRGRNVVNWAIVNGETEIGLTVHYMDEGVDTGDMVLQRLLPIGWTDDYATVLSRVVEAVPDMVSQAVALVVAGSASRQPQNHALSTYFGGRGAGDEWLDWSASSRRLHDLIRAITRPGPGARTLLGDREVRVWRAYWEPSWPRYIATPGQVVGRRSGGVLVKTGDSTLLLQEVQSGDSEPVVPTWPVGTRLGVDMAAALTMLSLRLDRLESRLLSDAREKEGTW